MTEGRLADLVDEGRSRLEQAREALDRLADGPTDAAWHAPVEALLAIVDEVVSGAGALAAGEAPDGERSAELGEAVDELKEAVAGLVERLAALGGEADRG